MSRKREPDPIAVERIVNGYRVIDRPHRADRWAAQEALDAKGLPAWRVAEMIGVSKRTVQRGRARRRAQEQGG